MFLFVSLFVVFLALAPFASSASARTWFIEPDGTGDAPTIQAGIDSAQAGDDVLLAAGTYTWTSQSATGTSMVRMKAGVWLHSESGAQATILDAESNGRVVLCQDVGNQTRIEGLTLQMGAALEVGLGGGGLLAIGDSNPTIVSCVIRNNRAIIDTPRGGGIYCDVATIQDCEILDNRVTSSGAGVRCGAAVIENCVFRGNVAGQDTGSGGAIFASSASIRNCVFEDNVAGGVASASGGAIAEAGLASIQSCVFINNTADSFGAGSGTGGAVAMYQGGTVSNCVFLGNAALGPASNEGGAIRAFAGGLIENCTILGSSGGHVNGVAGITMDGVGTVREVIIANTVQGKACSGSSGVTWICCNLFGNPLGNSICGIDGGGNFSADPQFCAVDPLTSLNVSLQEDSPCVPGNHPDEASCGLIGAASVGCGTISVEQRTWSELKALYR